MVVPLIMCAILMAFKVRRDVRGVIAHMGSDRYTPNSYGSRWNVRKSKNEPSVEFLSARLGSLDRPAEAVGAAVIASGGKAKRTAHKTLEVQLPGDSAKLRAGFVSMPRMTPEESVLVEQFLEHYRKTRQT